MIIKNTSTQVSVGILLTWYLILIHDWSIYVITVTEGALMYHNMDSSGVKKVFLTLICPAGGTRSVFGFLARLTESLVMQNAVYRLSKHCQCRNVSDITRSD